MIAFKSTHTWGGESNPCKNFRLFQPAMPLDNAEALVPHPGSLSSLTLLVSDWAPELCWRQCACIHTRFAAKPPANQSWPVSGVCPPELLCVGNMYRKKHFCVRLSWSSTSVCSFPHSGWSPLPSAFSAVKFITLGKAVGCLLGGRSLKLAPSHHAWS